MVVATIISNQNVFSYCDNRPITIQDSDGCRPIIKCDPQMDPPKVRSVASRLLRKTKNTKNKTTSSYSNGCTIIDHYVSNKDAAKAKIAEIFPLIMTPELSAIVFGLEEFALPPLAKSAATKLEETEFAGIVEPACNVIVMMQASIIIHDVINSQQAKRACEQIDSIEGESIHIHVVVWDNGDQYVTISGG